MPSTVESGLSETAGYKDYGENTVKRDRLLIFA